MMPVFRKGRSLAWAVPVLAEAAALGRSVAFAWVIGPEELGRAMMLALTVRLVEMASDVGADRLHGAGARRVLPPRFRPICRARWFCAGFAGALLLVCAAPILAMLFADGPAALSYALLALVPLLRGFAHLDLRRAERVQRYGPYGGGRRRGDAGDGREHPARGGHFSAITGR
jgi:hypothetical protein